MIRISSFGKLLLDSVKLGIRYILFPFCFILNILCNIIIYVFAFIKKMLPALFAISSFCIWTLMLYTTNTYLMYDTNLFSAMIKFIITGAFITNWQSVVLGLVLALIFIVTLNVIIKPVVYWLDYAAVSFRYSNSLIEVLRENIKRDLYEIKNGVEMDPVLEFKEYNSNYWKNVQKRKVRYSDM